MGKAMVTVMEKLPVAPGDNYVAALIYKEPMVDHGRTVYLTRNEVLNLYAWIKENYIDVVDPKTL